MKITGKVMSLIFGVMMIIPLGALVYYNRIPAPEAPERLVVDDKIVEIEAPFFLEDNRVFIRVQALSTMGIQSTVEAGEGRLVIPIGSGAVAYEDDVLTKQLTSQGGNVNFPLKALNDGWYIELERLDAWLGLRSFLTADKKNLLLDSRGERVLGIVSPGGSSFCSEPQGKGKPLRDLQEGERLRLFSENGTEYRIRTQDGLIGYGKQAAIISYPEKVQGQQDFTAVRNTPKQYGPINITFEYVSKYASNPDMSKETKIQGLDVLCPTWFSLNENAVVTNDGDIRYVRDAHKLGYRVWGVFRNGFDPDRTHQLLINQEQRARAIADIALYTAFYELDGINIDFENVYRKDQKALTGFLQDLDAALTRQGVVLSVDAAPPWGSDQWSLFLDRGAVARIADYIILMAYDEHYANSPESGSVASLGWTEKALEGTLESVPPDKLVLGVPLYTRVWTETPEDSGKVAVSSKAIGMRDQESLLMGKDPDYTFDEEAGQMLAVYKEAGTVKKIWMEDETSMKARIRLVDKHRLAGLASWRRGFETESFWAWVRETMKGR